MKTPSRQRPGELVAEAFLRYDRMRTRENWAKYWAAVEHLVAGVVRKFRLPQLAERSRDILAELMSEVCTPEWWKGQILAGYQPGQIQNYLQTRAREACRAVIVQEVSPLYTRLLSAVSRHIKELRAQLPLADAPTASPAPSGHVSQIDWELLRRHPLRRTNRGGFAGLKEALSAFFSHPPHRGFPNITREITRKLWEFNHIGWQIEPLCPAGDEGDSARPEPANPDADNAFDRVVLEEAVDEALLMFRTLRHSDEIARAGLLYLILKTPKRMNGLGIPAESVDRIRTRARNSATGEPGRIKKFDTIGEMLNRSKATAFNRVKAFREFLQNRLKFPGSPYRGDGRDAPPIPVLCADGYDASAFLNLFLERLYHVYGCMERE
ncbi:MAG TPA: hypothetical protein PLY73_05155 [Candidatus Ozemobacteraceae bacterium]|mgnify:CR=1 FL=1|nr:hypothetical protein [Candidatus Ozemobacteraceae bacterium]